MCRRRSKIKAASPRVISGDLSRNKKVTGRHSILSLLALLLILPGAVFAAVSSEDFDGITAQILSATDEFYNDSAIEWTFGQGPSTAQIAIAGTANGGTFTNGLSSDSTGDRVIFLNYNGCVASTGGSGCPGTTDITHFYMKSTDGSNFKLDSFQLGNNLAGYSITGTIAVKSGSTTVGSTSFDLNVSSSANGITYTYGGDSGSGSARPYGTFTFDATRYRNVNEITLDFPASSTPLVDNLIVFAAVANIAPTVSGQPSTRSFTQDTGGNLNLAGTTFADGNGDTLTVTLAISSGMFGATVADGSGIGSGVTATRVSDTSITLAGSAADINTYLASAGNITYIPPIDTSGTGVAALTISAFDGFDGLAADPTVSINVTAPVIVPTLAGWAQILLTFGLGLIAFVHLPRRNPE